MVGELNVAIAGQPATLEFAGDLIRLHLKDYQSAWRVHRTPFPDVSGWGRWLAKSGFQLQLRIGRSKSLELFPNPHWALRLSSPVARALSADVH